MFVNKVKFSFENNYQFNLESKDSIQKYWLCVLNVHNVKNEVFCCQENVSFCKYHQM